MKRENGFTPGWDEQRVRTVLEHYETQSEEEAVAEDEATFQAPDRTLMAVPPALAPEVLQMIDSYEQDKKAS